MMEENMIAFLARKKEQYDKNIFITYREFILVKADR